MSTLPPPPGYGDGASNPSQYGQPQGQPQYPPTPQYLPQAPAQYAPQPQDALPPQAQQQIAYLDLTVQGSRMTSNVIPPNVWVNGHLLTPEYGRRQVPVPAGPVRVDAEVQWTKKFGQASMGFQAQPGQTIPVFYAAPMHVFAKGNIGHVKQSRPGAWVMWVMSGFLVLFAGLMVALIVAVG